MHIKHLAQCLDITNQSVDTIFFFLFQRFFLSHLNSCLSIIMLASASVKIIIFIRMNSLPFMPNDV